jgi:hypothetical protein
MDPTHAHNVYPSTAKDPVSKSPPPRAFMYEVPSKTPHNPPPCEAGHHDQICHLLDSALSNMLGPGNTCQTLQY